MYSRIQISGGWWRDLVTTSPSQKTKPTAHDMTWFETEGLAEHVLLQISLRGLRCHAGSSYRSGAHGP